MRSVRESRNTAYDAARRLALLFAVAAAAATGACDSANVPRATKAEEQALMQDAAGSYRLQSGDKIRVSVYGENALTGEYPVDPGGFVSLPLVGTLKAAGLTQRGLTKELSDKLVDGGYIKNPKITVSIAEYRPFYILGEVEKPGAYPYSSGLNVLSAIAIAGGTTYRASHSDIIIQHAGERQPREYSFEDAIPILPGDIIQVPRRYF